MLRIQSVERAPSPASRSSSIVGDGRLEVCDGAQGVCDDGMCDLGTPNYAIALSGLESCRSGKEQTLYDGDNLEVLRQHVKDESVDLIHLDPPFNSRQEIGRASCRERV